MTSMQRVIHGAAQAAMWSNLPRYLKLVGNRVLYTCDDRDAIAAITPICGALIASQEYEDCQFATSRYAFQAMRQVAETLNTSLQMWCSPLGGFFYANAALDLTVIGCTQVMEGSAQ